MKRDPQQFTWPVERLGEALRALAIFSGFSPSPTASVEPDSIQAADPEVLGRWVESAATWLGCEADLADTRYSDLDAFLRTAGPALLRVPSSHDESQFLAVLSARRGRVLLIGPDFTTRRFPVKRVSAFLCRALENRYVPEIDKFLSEAGISARRRARARTALIRERFGAATLTDCWLLRLPQSAGFVKQLRQAGVIGPFVGLAAAHLIEYLMWVGSWWIVGQGALEGRLDTGWLWAWALLLLTTVPLRLLRTWWQGRIAIGIGGALKLRLLAGALRLEPDEVRNQGSGQFLGRVIESQLVESLALSGGFLALVAAIELLVAAIVLVSGAAGIPHALALLTWIAITLLLGWHYYRLQREWASTRLDMTNDLVERMVGHRTRLVQEDRAFWHEQEDQMIESYLAVSRRMDRSAQWQTAVAPRGWLVLGLFVLGVPFVNGGASPAALAVGLGGTLLAYQALQEFSAGIWNLVGARIAWMQIAPLFNAATRPEKHCPPVLVRPDSVEDDHSPSAVMEARNLHFRYPGRTSEHVLHGCTFAISQGDWKSTRLNSSYIPLSRMPSSA